MATTSKVYYSYDLKTVRYDTLATNNYRKNAPLRIIHDFNSGIWLKEIFILKIY